MSLDKAIKHGKEKRTEFRRSKAVDTTCRNHGSCPYCSSNRKHATKRQYGRVEDQEDEYFSAAIGAGDPTDVDMDYADELMERFGFDPNDSKDMVRSGLWWNPKIEAELKKYHD